MKRINQMLLVLGLTLTVRMAAAETADVVLVNGKVLTVDASFSVQSAVAIKDGKILAVGGPEIGRRFKAAQRIDLQDRMVMPGFIDAHVQLYNQADAVGKGTPLELDSTSKVLANKPEFIGTTEWQQLLRGANARMLIFARLA